MSTMTLIMKTASRRALGRSHAVGSLHRHQSRFLTSASRTTETKKFIASTPLKGFKSFKSSTFAMRVAIGLTIFVPSAALLQGIAMITDYRKHHRDVTFVPPMPQQGRIMGKESAGNKEDAKDRRPLRLLVIGDSLAVGVGGSSGPVLPRTIARSLSAACGDREVHWVVMGSPGSTVSQIVRDIRELQMNRHPETTQRAEQLISTWQRKRETWIQMRQERRNQREQEEMKGEESRPKPMFMWMRATQRVLEEWHDIRVAFFTEDESADSSKAPSLPNEDDHENQPFDIAVVLLGINDIKDQYLPSYLTTGQESSIKEGTQRLLGTFFDQLHHVIDALKAKMVDQLDLRSIEGDNETSDKESTEREAAAHSRDSSERSDEHSESSDSMPTIVLPALPVAKVQLFQVRPLCWFLFPIVQAMEDGKRRLAQRFPNLVLFVDSPTSSGDDCMDVAKVDNWTSDNDGSENNVTSSESNGLIASDQVHPNDAGYDLWGRHIAAAIIEHMKQKEQLRQTRISE